MSSDTITQTLLAQFGELATRNLTAELAEARYEASLPSQLVTLDLAAEQPAEPFPLTAPGMPVPGQDVLRLALAQGAELAWAGKGKDLRLAESDGTLERIYHRLLHSAGQYHLPLSIDQHTAKSLSVVTGHRWDHAVTGPVPADVFVLSKMLGEEEKRAARNFVGPSGELLRDLCDTLRVPGYADWYVTNVFKAEHPQAEAGNSTLKSSWIAEFLPLLHMELRLVRPKYILCIGADALKVLLGKRATLDGMLGRVVEYTYPVGRTADDHREHTALVMACTHPAAVLRTPELETKLQNDLTRWGQLVQGFRPDQPEVDIDHRAIESPAELAALAREIDRDIVRNTISLDAEWHGDHPENAGAYVRSIQLSWGPKKAAYIHVTHPGGAWRFGGSQAELCAALKQICRGRRLVGQFLLSDMARLLALGLDLRDEFAVAADWQTFMETNLSDRPTGGFDIGLALHAIDETADFGLTAQTLRFTGAPRYDVPLEEWKAAYCHTHQIKPKELDGYGECPDDVLVPYGNYDADIPSRLVGLYEELLTCDRFGNNCWEALWMSMRATPAVLEMETTGMLIDRRRVDELSQVYMAARQRLSDEIKQWARWPDFNLQSTYEVREFLFGESLNGKKRVDPLIPVRIRPRGAKSLKIDPAMSTDKRPVPWPEVVRRGETHLKQPSTNKTSLAILAQDNQAVPRTSNRGNGILVDYSPIIMKLRDYRFISQVLKSVLRDPDANEAGDFIMEDGFHTYSGGLPGRICGDGRIRTRISQVKETGRWSSWNPALQNLSKKREADYERVLGDLYRWAIRTIICATPGYLLVEADFTGAELLGMALLSGDATMIAHALRAALPEEHPDYYDIHSNVTVLAFGLSCPPIKSGLKSVGKGHLRTVAKCVTGATRIETSEGWKRVSELVGATPARQGTAWEGPPVRLGSHGRPTPLLAVYNGGHKQVLRVTTTRGHWLDAARDHHFLVMGSDGELTFRKARDLRVGDWLCRQGREGLFGSDTLVPPTPAIPRTNHKPLALPGFFDEDWAAFVGLYLAEGAMCRAPGGSTVGFQLCLAAETAPEFAVKTSQLLQRLFGDRLQTSQRSYEKYDDQLRWVVSSTDLGEWLARWIPGNSHTKQLPEFVFGWPKRLQAVLLRWLFAGDGTVRKNGSGFAIGYATASEALARGIALLLSNFGIPTTLRAETREGYAGTYWEIKLFSNAARARFISEVGFVTAAAATTVQRISQFSCDRRVIPGQVSKLERLLPFVPGPVAKEKCRECVRQRARVALSPTRLALILQSLQQQALPDDLREVYDALQALLDRDICFEQVRAIEDRGRQPVYDVETSDTEAHVVNYDGFYTHQSVIFGLAYGRGAKAIALALREEGVLVSVEDAQRIIDTVLEMYPGLVPFFADCRARALTERWICGCFGRFRRFPQARDFRMQGDIERQAMNFPIQGLVGDAATRACDHLYHYRETHPLVDYRIVMQIHDAILLEVPYGHVGVVMREVLPECMSQAVPIYPTDLAGLPTGAGPYHMGVDVECYQAWGEKMQPHQFLACGLDPELGHWHAAEGGWTRADKPGKLWVGDVTGGGWQALPESTGQVNRSSLG